MAERMQRMWSPGTSVGYDSILAGDVGEYQLAPSAALQSSQNRLVRDFTVTRIVGNLQFTSVSETVFMYGIRFANENEPIGTYNPGTDQTIDWMLWGSIVVGNTTQLGIAASSVEIDNRSQRKSHGLDSGCRLFIVNIAGDDGYVSVALRTLMLV